MNRAYRTHGIIISEPTYALWGVPVGEGREKGAERICDHIMSKNFPNLMKYINKNTQEA